MSSSALVKDVSVATFAADVLERSRTLPVVVDFWAAWCAPCRVLGPVLEREVTAHDGAVELAKIDTDANQALAVEYGIQGIPAVKAFRDGRVVDEFVGARPAAFIRSWLAALARVLLDAGDATDAASLLARLEARGDAPDTVESLRARLRLVEAATAAGGRAGAEAALAKDPTDREARYALGAALVAAGETEAALEQFLDLASAPRKPRADDARRAMLAIFDQLGTDDEMARDFRRRLQIVS